MMHHDYGAAEKTDRVTLTRSSLTESPIKNFTTPDDFMFESFSLSIRGMVRSEGATFDYTITGNNSFLVLCDLDPTDNMVVEYIKS